VAHVICSNAQSRLASIWLRRPGSGALPSIRRRRTSLDTCPNHAGPADHFGEGADLTLCFTRHPADRGGVAKRFRRDVDAIYKKQLGGQLHLLFGGLE
jgi:hypothetical protein